MASTQTDRSFGGYTQANRPMEILTPLGKDALLLVGFTGHEAISQLFNFQMELLAENGKTIAFDKLLGQKVTVRLDIPGGKRRYFNGICIRFSQGRRDQVFTHFKMEIVPQFWLFTKKAEIRTFQHMTIPDILKKMLSGLDVAYEIQGTFQERDYCVQYRETDFNFCCRLMEEEGIYYFFKHTADGHKMVLANTPQSHPDLPERSQIIFEETMGGKREEDRVLAWEKVQELRTGAYKLWDHCFEMPYKSLMSKQIVQDTVQVGQVTHKLRAGRSDQIQMRDFPGEYAGRFDGVNKGGKNQPAELEKIFKDNVRTVGIRMQQEAVQMLTIQGISTCRQFVSGHKFDLQRHFDADGKYVLTSVQHDATMTGDYRGGETGEYLYENSFTCIPIGLPFRPPRVTPKPTVEGTHTALVVGPPGEEIFTDKYGRVKVQFKWDGDGTNDSDSSCWVRVTQPWTGQRWGMYHIPRMGQEVIVDFLEGDADQPIITGMVFNAHQMPTYLGDGLDPKHAHNPHISGIKTCSTPGGDGYNELRFLDTKGKEQVFHHCERNQDTRVKNDSMENIDNDKHMIVGGQQGGGNLHEQIENNKHQHVKNSHFEKIAKDMQKLIGGNQDHVTQKDSRRRVEGDDNHQVNGDQKMKTDQNQSETIDQDRKVKVGGNDNLHVMQDQRVQVEQNQRLNILGDRSERVSGDWDLQIMGKRREKISDTYSILLGKDLQVEIGEKCGFAAKDEIHLLSKKVVIEAESELTIRGPGGFVKIDKGGVWIVGKPKVQINSGGEAGKGSGANADDVENMPPDPPDDPDSPDAAQNAKPKAPNEAEKSKSGIPSDEGAPIGDFIPGGTSGDIA